jgi:hypothetical protein
VRDRDRGNGQGCTEPTDEQRRQNAADSEAGNRRGGTAQNPGKEYYEEKNHLEY